MSESYLSVTQINNYIKGIFESEIMLQNICVYGEISSYNISNGIAYFNLKDENGLLTCVLFGANNFAVPKVGDMILAKGSMSYYSKGGKLSFNAYSIMPYGKGLLYQKYLELKDKLDGLGWFDPSIKKPVPEKVKRIGVVSSPTGAVIRDIIDVTHRRNDTLDIVLFPVKVQGVGSENEIAKGINFFSEYEDVDVVIVARGGGSMEDLEPFNTEIVATATHNCKKPIVSAVGHETDFTIIDFVSDLRAPTPSAAAELVAWDKCLEIERINKCLTMIERNLNNITNLFRKDIDILYEKMDNISSSKINQYYINLSNKLEFINLFKLNIETKQSLIDNLNLKLESLNPNKLSNMGYSKILQDGCVISRTKDVNHDNLIISMIDGNIDCKVVGKVWVLKIK